MRSTSDNVVERVYRDGSAETIGGYQVQRIHDGVTTEIVLRDVAGGFDIFSGDVEDAKTKLAELLT